MWVKCEWKPSWPIKWVGPNKPPRSRSGWKVAKEKKCVFCRACAAHSEQSFQIVPNSSLAQVAPSGHLLEDFAHKVRRSGGEKRRTIWELQFNCKILKFILICIWIKPVLGCFIYCIAEFFICMPFVQGFHQLKLRENKKTEALSIEISFIFKYLTLNNLRCLWNMFCFNDSLIAESYEFKSFIS